MHIMPSASVPDSPRTALPWSGNPLSCCCSRMPGGALIGVQGSSSSDSVQAGRVPMPAAQQGRG